MKLVSVHRPDRVAISNESGADRAEKNRPLVTVRETGPSSLLVLAEGTPMRPGSRLHALVQPQDAITQEPL